MLDAHKSVTSDSLWQVLADFADQTLNRLSRRINKFNAWVDAKFAPSRLAAKLDQVLVRLNRQVQVLSVALEEESVLLARQLWLVGREWSSLTRAARVERLRDDANIEWAGLMAALQQIADVLPQTAYVIRLDVQTAVRRHRHRIGSLLFWLVMSVNGLVGLMLWPVLATHSAAHEYIPLEFRNGGFEFPANMRGQFSFISAPVATPTPLPTATPAPTSTPEPVLTATPIPMPTLLPSWASTLPQYGGWSGGGQCWGPVIAPIGSGTFIWPTDHHVLVGRNYSYWHPGLDLGGNLGDPLYASDSGVVVYAGWNTYGYGNLVIVDHGNGWHTLYAHFSEIYVACGEAVMQGQVLGAAGTTGYSTGPHLHFEMRFNGGYASPWNYLP